MQSQKQLEYQAYLSTDHWKNKRSTILEKRGCTCEKCEEWGNEIHHLTYDNLWNEKDEDLQVLCDDCHEATHRALKSIRGKEKYKKKKKKIHRRALYAALSQKQKDRLIIEFNLLENELYAFILYSNEKDHFKIIKTAAQLLGFDGFHPKIVKQSRRANRPSPYKNMSARNPMRLI